MQCQAGVWTLSLGCCIFKVIAFSLILPPLCFSFTLMETELAACSVHPSVSSSWRQWLWSGGKASLPLGILGQKSRRALAPWQPRGVWVGLGSCAAFGVRWSLGNPAAQGWNGLRGIQCGQRGGRDGQGRTPCRGPRWEGMSCGGPGSQCPQSVSGDCILGQHCQRFYGASFQAACFCTKWFWRLVLNL